MLDFQASRWLMAARCRAGRQRPPDRHPDRRVPDRRRADQHRRLGRPHVPALLRGARRAGAARRPATTRPARRARRTAKRSTRRSPTVTKRTERRLGRADERGRRAVRPDLHDRPDLRRPAGAAPGDGAADGSSARLGEIEAVVGQAIGLIAARRRRCAPADARARRAHRRGAARDSATTPQGCASPSCTPARESILMGSGSHVDIGTTKMIAEKDGAIGRLDLQQPGGTTPSRSRCGRRCRRSLDDFEKDPSDPRDRRHRRRREGVRLGRRHLGVQGEARARGERRAYNKIAEAAQRALIKRRSRPSR